MQQGKENLEKANACTAMPLIHLVTPTATVASFDAHSAGIICCLESFLSLLMNSYECMCYGLHCFFFILFPYSNAR